MPDGVVCESSIQVRRIIVMWKVLVDFLQQQVCTFWGKIREVRVFLRGGTPPPHLDNLYWCPPWGLSVLILFLLNLGLFLILRLRPTTCGLVALLRLVPPSAGGGSTSLFPCFLPLSSASSASSVAAPARSPPTPGPSGVLGLLFEGCRGLATRWASPWW